jgi:hypothetical protein
MAETSRRFLLSPLAVTSLVMALVVGELVSGTSPYFVTMMAIAMLSVCVTYNVLGGLGRIAGIGFTSFALQTLVVSQVGKVILFERADQNMDVPLLTITVYAVYFFALMLGVLAFSRLRVSLPRPSEPDTSTESSYLYAISLVGGLVGAFGVAALDLAGPAAQTSLTHGFARALAYLLPFSLVLAVDARIRKTHGEHCFGWMALWPALGMMSIGFLGTGRGQFMEPLVIVFLTGHVRDFRFRRKHLAAAAVIVAALFLFISPYLLWARGWTGKAATMGEEATTMLRALESAPSQWVTIKHEVGEADLGGSGGTVSYFPTPGAVTLNRLVLISKDSTLINACSSGFHYGFTALKLDILTQVPRFLYPNKPTIGSNGYLGHLDGQESDEFETTNSTVTSISDSYGAFSWIGVVLFALLVPSAICVIYESIFDITRPWGTVAAMMLVLGWGGPMGGQISETMIKNPAYILIISWCAAWGIRMIPKTGDRRLAWKKGYRPVLHGAAGRPSESGL